LKILLSTLIFLGIAVSSFAADVEMGWNEVADATGYKVYMSLDQGQTWEQPVDVGMAQQDPDNPLRRVYTYTDVPEDRLILFKGSAYNDDGESIREWSGAWYDYRGYEEE